MYLTRVNDSQIKAHGSDLLSRQGISWSGWLVVLWLAMLSGVSVRAQGLSVVINEVMANNESIPVLPDFPDYFPDYVELYNPNPGEVDLGAGLYRIADSGATNSLSGLKIPGRGYLVLICDDQPALQGEFHTGFGLNATEGEVVRLFRNLTVQVDFVSLGIQAPDYSLGRVPDGTGILQLNAPTPEGTNVVVSLGNPFVLRINEWLATNSAGADRDWFEVYNPDSNAVSLAGLVFADRSSSNSVPYSFLMRPTPANSYIAPYGFVQIFASDRDKDADEVGFSLSSTSGDDIWIFAGNSLTGAIDHVTFRAGQQRNVSEGRLPDGEAYVDASGNNKKFPNPSPRATNFKEIEEIVINELLAHVDPPLEDAIELYNRTGTNVSIGGWWLTNNRNKPKKYQIPPGTIIEAGGFHVFYEYEFNNPTNLDAFNLNSAHGGEVYLFSADADGELLGYRRGLTFGASENGVSFGRWLNSATNVDLVPMASLTFGTDITRNDDPSLTNAFRTGRGAVNRYPKVGPVVISEIHYHPPDIGTNSNTIDEYVELRNITTNDVPLFDPNEYTYDGVIYAYGVTNTWRLRGGINYVFPTNITLAAGSQLLVVNFDPEADPVTLGNFRSKFSVPGPVQIVGPYKGKLANGGATVELFKPDPPQSPRFPDEVGFVPYISADLVKYRDKLPWPVSDSTNRVGPDGFGQSIQRVVLIDFGNEPSNWVGAWPTAGRMNSSNDLALPVIVTHPDPAVPGVEGGDVQMTVVAAGEALSYRWQFNGVQINGVAGNVLVLQNLTTNMAGNYRAVVLNAAGAVYSTEAVLTVANRSDVTNDFVAPSVTITAPADGSEFANPNQTVRGAATDNVGLAYVEISLNDGPFTRVTGTRLWSIDVVMNPGVNMIRARATDLNTNRSAVVTHTVTYVTNSVDLEIVGQGTVPGLAPGTRLEVGRTYTFTAKPASGWVFREWQRDASGTSPKLTFVMRTGLKITAVFEPNPFGNGVAGTYNGLFYNETNGVTPETAGYFSLQLNDRGSYSASLLLGGKRYPARGTFDYEGLSTNVITRPAPLVPLRIEWKLNLGGNAVKGILFFGSDTNLPSVMIGDRATHHVLYNRAPHGGLYTFAIPGGPLFDPGQPEGYSHGSLQIGSNGKAILTGTMSENFKFSQETTISKDGNIPLYFPAYGGRGILQGWFNLGPVGPTNQFSGSSVWIKPESAGGSLYTNGFVMETNIIGSAYEIPGITNRMLNVDGQALFALFGGNVIPALSYVVDLPLGGNVTYTGVDKLTFNLAKPKGQFTGKLVRQGNAPVRFSGTFLQAHTNAVGFVIGTNRIGRMSIVEDR